MQKNRTALAAGILALALVVGGFALYNNQKASKSPEVGYTDEPSTAASATPKDTDSSSDVSTHDDKGTTKTTTTDTKTDSKTGSAAMTVPATHTVQKGETLRDIANHYYHNPVYAGDIERVNNLDDPNIIYAGKVLKLPRPEELNSSAPAADATKPEKTATPTDDEMPTN